MLAILSYDDDDVGYHIYYIVLYIAQYIIAEVQ